MIRRPLLVAAAFVVSALILFGALARITGMTLALEKSERTALQRLMGEHGTREEQLDDLLRGEVLVDLYRVTRQELRLSLSRAQFHKESLGAVDKCDRNKTGCSVTKTPEVWR